MGITYGQRRGRLERINPKGAIGYSISSYDINFAHIDPIEEVARIVNRKLDIIEDKVIERLYRV